MNSSPVWPLEWAGFLLTNVMIHRRLSKIPQLNYLHKWIVWTWQSYSGSILLGSFTWSQCGFSRLEKPPFNLTKQLLEALLCMFVFCQHSLLRVLNALPTITFKWWTPNVDQLKKARFWKLHSVFITLHKLSCDKTTQFTQSDRLIHHYTTLNLGL